MTADEHGAQGGELPASLENALGNGRPANPFHAWRTTVEITWRWLTTKPKRKSKPKRGRRT